MGHDVWEKLLVAHYLRSDGPFGDAQLRSIDATPPELVKASRDERMTAEAAKGSFVACFKDMSTTRDVFRGNHVPRPFARTSPGFFRYLVLSTLVPALSDDDLSERDFRQRFGRLLDLDGPLSALEGLPNLWERLARWCDRLRDAGEPFRRIILPDRRHMRIIGYSMGFAFPSWRDRERLERDVLHIGPEEVASPVAAISRLQHQIEFGAYSAPMREAFEDFRKRFQRGERLLLEQRFWRLLCEVRDRTREPAQQDSGSITRLSLVIGLDDADLELEFTKARKGGPLDEDNDIVRLAGPAGTVLEELTRSFARPSKEFARGEKEISEAIRFGILVFYEESWGKWSFKFPSSEWPDSAIAICRSDLTHRFPASRFGWRLVASSWQVSGILPAGALEKLADFMHQQPFTNSQELATVEIIGGCPTGQALLGRSTLLPHIRAPADAQIRLHSVEGNQGHITIPEIGPRTWALVSSGPVSGTWRLSVRDDVGSVNEPLETERVLRFSALAIEHHQLADPDQDPVKLELEREIDSGSEAVLHARPLRQAEMVLPPEGILLDLTEAVYAGGRAGWSESDLVSLIRQVLDGSREPSPWDVLHLLQVGGWLEARLLTRWKGRRWYLRRPRIVHTGAGSEVASILDGAAPLIFLERFQNIGEKLGGRVAPSSLQGQWCLPVTCMTNVDPLELADRLGISCEPALELNTRPAPMCWPAEGRSIEYRALASSWSWSRRHFVRADKSVGQGVRLERYIRTRADDRDIFIVGSDNQSDRVFGSRTAAVIEAHRLAERPLFNFDDYALRRTALDGHLPLVVARMLRFLHQAAPFLQVADPGSPMALAYPADENSARLLGTWFGRAVGLGSIRSALGDDYASIAVARHRGRAHLPIWEGELKNVRLKDYDNAK